MNHNHIYSDSVSCEQLKAVDIISKDEGHVCPTSPPPYPPKKNKQPTNKRKRYKCQILYNLAVPAITLLEIFGNPAHYLSNVFRCPAY